MQSHYVERQLSFEFTFRVIESSRNIVIAIGQKLFHRNSQKGDWEYDVSKDFEFDRLQVSPVIARSVGCLKQLVYLSLARVPIKRLPASFTNLAALQILVLEGSEITELPSDLDRLRSLSYLALGKCRELKCVPCSI